jgi:predicted O-linked N-acetylglucosamine transferase (SPINDLY family)
MDYVIADRFVLPESLRPHFSERVVYLPRCYQPSDPTRVVGAAPSRETCGLPPGEPGVVYACFNASFKLNPRSFARMVRVIAAVPGSVLWLMRGPGRATERLREEARAMDVDPGRLVFMEKMPHTTYLARYRHADLFLDTEHYNAHTVASDALWAGCPVLTRPGGTFATRVAGSLNYHLGMGDMNVRSDDDFVALAIRYGRDASYRAATRKKLAHRKRRSELFDVAGYADDFVALLTRLSAHHRVGGAPDDFSE